MTVYEATTRKDYRKIVEFLKRQPKESLSLKCWRTEFGDVNEAFFEQVKLMRPQTRIWYVEDENGGVRAVLAYQERSLESKLVTMAFACIDYSDVVNDNRVYYDGLVDFVIRNEIEKGYVKGMFWGAKNKMMWSKELFGDALQILKEIEHPQFGKVYLYTIDFVKYLEG